jgi:sulfite exporter TauE/SafE
VVIAFLAACPAECVQLIGQLAGVQHGTIEQGIDDRVTFLAVTLAAMEVRAVTGIAVGLVVAAVGVNYATGRGVRSISVPGFDRVTSPVRNALLWRVDEWGGDYRIAGLGAVHGFLPCPLLYPAYLYALVQGSTLGGAAALAALGVALPATPLPHLQPW